LLNIKNGVLCIKLHLVGVVSLDNVHSQLWIRRRCSMEAYIAALISCITSGVFYLIDAIMKKDTYSRASQPMAVSSLFAILPAILLACLAENYNAPDPTVFAKAIAFGSGVLLMIGSWIYFQIVYSDVGECTEVSVFENSSVIMIALFTLFMHTIGIQMYEVITSSQWLGVLIASCALVAIHLCGDRLQLVDWKHRVMLVIFMCFAAADEVTIDWALHLTAGLTAAHSERMAFLAISPYHWAGFSTGILVMLIPVERKEFKVNLSKILASWKLIIFAELVALLAFASMVYGFATGHVAVIAIISGSFPIVVFLGGILLRRKFGFSEEKFPIVQHPWKKGIAILIVILGITLAAWG
jgi:hypothetical protein